MSCITVCQQGLDMQCEKKFHVCLVYAVRIYVVWAPCLHPEHNILCQCWINLAKLLCCTICNTGVISHPQKRGAMIKDGAFKCHFDLCFLALILKPAKCRIVSLDSIEQRVVV